MDEWTLGSTYVTITQQQLGRSFMPTYVAQWKKIKADYETATNRKKPSDTLLGVIKTKTGLESGFTAMDAALKKSDVEEAQKVLKTLEKSAMAYRKVLMKAAVAEKNKEVQKETNTMMDELEELIESSQLSIRDAGAIPSVATLREFSALTKTPAFDRVEEFAKKKLRTESLEFLQAMLKKDYSKNVFNKFIKDNDINIAVKIIEKFDENNLKSGPWAEVTMQVLLVFNGNIIRPLNSVNPA